MADETKNLNESVDKVRLTSTITRGTGTRDQEKHKLNVRGETPEEAAANLAVVVEELEEHGVFERTREIKFEGGEDE